MNRKIISILGLVVACVMATVVARGNISSPIVCGKENIRVEFYSPRTVRIVKTPSGASLQKPFTTLKAKPMTENIKVSDEGETVVWKSNELVVRLNKKNRVIEFLSSDGKRILSEKESASFQNVQYNGKDAMRSKQSFAPTKEEGLYGLGDLQNGLLNQRGIKARLMPDNIGDGVPYVASSKGWAIWWDNTSPTEFEDNGLDKFFFDSEVSTGVDYFFMWGKSGDGCIAEMRELTGDVPMFPRWAYGFWQSRERYKTPDETVGAVKHYRDLGIPLDGIVQDWQYWGGNEYWNAMDFIGKGWEGGSDMIRKVHEMNSKIIITIWQSFGNKTELGKILKEKNLLFPFSTWPKNVANLCDNFSPVTQELYWNKLQKFRDLEIDGWWMDSTDPDLHYKEGDFEYPTSLGCTFRTVRNAYPISAVKNVYERQRKLTDKKRVFILTRGASAGQQAFATSVWSGDIQATWDVLRCQVPGGLNYTITGNPQFNTDLGGFYARHYNQGGKGTKNAQFRELYTRWFQLGTFLPMMRSHGTDIPREVYLYGEKGEEIYDSLVNAIRLRYQLMPTIYSIAGHVTKDRASVMRPVWFDYSNDESTLNRANQFLFGDQILVTPILNELYTSNLKVTDESKLNDVFLGEKEFSVYLPNGTDWWHFESGKCFKGGLEHKFNVSMRSQPFFVKAGGILLLGPQVQYNGEKDWSDLTVNVYPGANGEFNFYEDAFESYDYEKGKWSEIPFRWNDLTDTLTIGERRGSFPQMIPVRNFTIHIPGFEDKKVRYEGKEISIKMEIKTYKTNEFRIRDPFVMPENGVYYLYESKPWYGSKAVEVRTSTDLKTWTEKAPVLVLPEELKNTAAWAPEVHKYKGAYYLFTTLSFDPDSSMTIKPMMQEGYNGGKLQPRGVWIFKSDSPYGPFKRVKDGSVTPQEWMCLDGTLWVEDGKPWMIFCHEWCQTGNGRMMIAQLSDDLSKFVSEPKEIFRASDVKNGGFVTDGPFLFTDDKQGLHMIWSSILKDGGYCVVQCKSESGKVTGPWKSQNTVYDKDGGHGMIFKGFDGNSYLTFHQPNNTPDERMVIIPIKITSQGISQRAQ